MSVYLRDNESFESLLKRFDRYVRNNGIMDDVRDTVFFVKPSDAKRKKRTQRKRVNYPFKLPKRQEPKMDRSKQRKPRPKHQPVNEFFTKKYDDLGTNERIILVKISSGHKSRWSNNDFRSVPSFNNDGDLIAGAIRSLVEKGYLKMSKFGDKTVFQLTEEDS
jgi:ribosomal protein S21